MSRHRLWDAPKPTGYRVGPVVVGASPFPLLWQADPRVNDGHRHRWETVLLTGRNVRVDEVVRCAVCLAPRCSGPTDRNPCMLRRHHPDAHHLLYGHLRLGAA